MDQQSECVSFVSPQSNVSAAIPSSRIRGSIYRVISRLFMGHFQDHLFLVFWWHRGRGGFMVVIRLLEKTVQAKLTLKKPTVGLLILHNTATTDQLWQRESSNPRYIGFAVLRDSISDWVLKAWNRHLTDSSGNQACTGAPERYFPCTGSTFDYIHYIWCDLLHSDIQLQLGG